MGGVVIDIKNLANNAPASVETWDQGGYQVELDPGSYQVSARVGDRIVRSETVNIGTQNVKVDYDLSKPWSGETVAKVAVQAPASAPAPAPAPAPKVEAKVEEKVEKKVEKKLDSTFDSSWITSWTKWSAEVEGRRKRSDDIKPPRRGTRPRSGWLCFEPRPSTKS